MLVRAAAAETTILPPRVRERNVVVFPTHNSPSNASGTKNEFIFVNPPPKMPDMVAHILLLAFSATIKAAPPAASSATSSDAFNAAFTFNSATKSAAPTNPPTVL
jgi:hypothetical protein